MFPYSSVYTQDDYVYHSTKHHPPSAFSQCLEDDYYDFLAPFVSSDETDSGTTSMQPVFWVETDFEGPVHEDMEIWLLTHTYSTREKQYIAIK